MLISVFIYFFLIIFILQGKPVLTSEKLKRLVDAAADKGAKNIKEFLRNDVFDAVLHLLPGSHQGSFADHKQRWKSTLGKKDENYYILISKGKFEIKSQIILYNSKISLCNRSGREGE
jgi:hypothetical protein